MQQAIALGTIINKRYQVQKTLSDTTSNRRYLAEDTDQSNRLVVISFPRMELQTLPGFAAAFNDACQHLMKARLSGLLKILDHGEHESQPYSVLQYVTHETLESTLTAHKNNEKKLSVDEVLDWARPLAVTLDELHALDYVHSNVRPTTIFLDQKRQVLLGDFITEFAIQRLGAFKQVIASLDIADHLAPEYIKSNYNESYDQYLLATIIYEALAGRSHFHNPGSTEAYRRQVATKFPEPLLTHRPELVGASRILGKALERNPVKRFATCREFVNQLGSAQINPIYANTDDKPVTVIKKVLDLDETVPAEPIITSIRSDRSLGRKKGIIWLGVLLLGTGAAAYAVNHLGGLDQFKTRLTTAWSDLTTPQEVPSVQIVTVAPAAVDSAGTSTTNTATAPTVKASDNNDDKKQAKVVSSNTAGTSSSRESTANNETTVQAPAVGVTSKTIVSETVAAVSAADKPLPPETKTVAVENINRAESQAPATQNSDPNKTALVATQTVDANTLNVLVSQALREGETEFITRQSTATGGDEALIIAKIDDAIRLALREGHADYLQQNTATSPSGELPASDGSNTVKPVGQSPALIGGAGNESSVSGQTSSSEDQAQDLSQNQVSPSQAIERAAEPDASSTVLNKPLSPEEIEAEGLNEKMLQADQLADERAAAAKLAAEEKKRVREERGEAKRKLREEAKKKQEEEAQAKAAEEAAKVAEAEAQANNQAAPAAKSFAEMQQERARIQAIKAQKMARINSITKDCVTSGKIHRQVAAGNLPYVKNCLSVGVDPNVTQSNRWTLLHLASLGGYLNMAKLLVAKGASINAKAADGKTPLDMAVEQKKERLVRYLRTRGGVTTR
ncbi:MAG: ankyrin repeat domain-containing protein [Leucothrix sp.]